MTEDLPAEVHAELADTAQLAGSTCAVMSLGFLLLTVGQAVAGQPAALLMGGMCALMLACAHISWNDADAHRSAAARSSA